MAVKIITDSSSDISALSAASHNIEILPLKIIFGTEEFLSGITMSNELFYSRLENSGEFPKTSQPTPLEITEVFKKYLDNGDDVVAIFLSSNMSGTYHSACLVKEELGAENLHIIDSRTVTFALGTLVMEAVRLRDSGMSAADIAETCENLKNRIVLYAAIDTLKYLQMGGRIRSSTAIIGSMLNIKPIITIKDGLVETVEKQRGLKRAFERILAISLQHGIDTSLPRFIAHTNSPDQLTQLSNFLEQSGSIDMSGFFRTDIGPTVGVHVGPGAVGLSFFCK